MNALQSVLDRSIAQWWREAWLWALGCPQAHLASRSHQVPRLPNAAMCKRAMNRVESKTGNVDEILPLRSLRRIKAYRALVRRVSVDDIVALLASLQRATQVKSMNKTNDNATYFGVFSNIIDLQIATLSVVRIDGVARAFEHTYT
jgi:hypothetical protein